MNSDDHSEKVFDQYEGAGPRRTWHETGAPYPVQVELQTPCSTTISFGPGLSTAIPVDKTVRSHTISTTHLGRHKVERHHRRRVPMLPRDEPIIESSDPST